MRWSENQTNIKKEIALLGFMNQHENFTKLLDVLLFEDEVWAVMEYCNSGNLVDLISITELKESEMAYIAREVLKGLAFLHSKNRMHRGNYTLLILYDMDNNNSFYLDFVDLTTDDILINNNGDILITDTELWMGNNLQRFWLPPELLLSEPYPYGPEVC